MTERVAKTVEPSGGAYFAHPQTELSFIPTGSKVLDLALGGGWAMHRIANIIGDFSSGKTLLAIEVCANFARLHKDGKIFYRETEAAFQRSYAEALGLPTNQVDFCKDPLETVEDLFEDLVKQITDNPDTENLYIIDSLDALSDRDELKRKIDAGSYGAAKAKMMSQLFRRLGRKFTNMTIIIVSQIRDNIGVTFGPKYTRSGGRALDFYASQFVALAKTGKVTRTIGGIERIIGVDIRARVEKSKVGLPFREAHIPILFGWGLDDITSCLDWLDENKCLESVGVQKGKIADTAKKFMKMPYDEFVEQQRMLHAAVEENWWRIESSFLPDRQKYQD